MGVTCVIYGASDEEIGELLRSPPSIHPFLREAIPIERPGCLGSLMGERPKVLPPTRPVLGLGKSWGALHYILSGTKEDVALPKAFVTRGGALIGDEEVGYGLARALKSRVVKQIAEDLHPVTEAVFRESTRSECYFSSTALHAPMIRRISSISCAPSRGCVRS